MAAPGQREARRAGVNNARMFRVAWVSLAAVLSLVSAARADEGMWTFDNFPSARVAQSYGFTPSQAFLDHVRKSSLRIAGGCSASFVSPAGLVMTNHHCVVGCVGELSTPQKDYVRDGFLARTSSDEKACPNFELDQLVRIEDVTKTITAATAGKSGEAANTALRAAQAQVEATCGRDSAVRCDVVSLYHGGVYDLYHYKRYNDVRLVFAPEYGVAQFGGDPDNFNFPRFDFDIGIVRAYEDGKRAASPDYLRWSKDGSKAGDLAFVSGNPGSTQRELTVSQLEYIRRYGYTQTLPAIAEYRGIVEQFEARGPEQLREANEIRFYNENTYKALRGRQAALEDPAFFGRKVEEEKKLRDAVAANAAAGTTAGSAWDDIAALQNTRAELARRYEVAEGGAFANGLLGYARTLVRAAAERTRPNAERLDEYRDARLVAVRQELAASVPIYPDLEEVSLAFRLTQARERLGTDDPLVQKLLGRESPAELAHRLVAGTKLGDVTARTALYDGGRAAIDASRDPMIVYAKAIDGDARAIRKSFETRIDAPSRAAAEKIAKSRFAVYGTSVDPDATFTLRLSYGTVKGFDANGTAIAPYTTMRGLFGRATGAEPYVLPPSWLAAKGTLDLSTPMNLVTTNDIIGGNSGSPLVDRDGDVIGLIFDGNIYSLGGAFGYDATQNRAVSVDSRALLAGLGKVYHADRIVREIESART